MGRTAYTPLLASKRKFKQHGDSGLWVSDWYPEIATCVDDLAVVRSCYADGLNHVGSVCQMNTGSILGGRPCLGSWTLYGLGSESDNLPGYVVLLDYPEDPPGGSRNWSTGFMPAALPGHALPRRQDAGPASRTARRRSRRAAARPSSISSRNSTASIAPPRAEDSELEARIAAYELAYKMQSSAPEAVDLAQETDETKRLYGLDDKATERFGRNCLLARRLVERGVRFVQLYSGSRQQVGCAQRRGGQPRQALQGDATSRSPGC